MLQLPGTYGDLQPVGFEGSAGDLAPSAITTGVNETEAMPFGRMVAFDTTGTVDRSVMLTDGAADILMGITYHTQFGTQFDLTTGVAQVSTVTVGGADTAGVYSIGVSFDGGTTVHVAPFTRVAEATAAIATALRAALVANAAINNQAIITGAVNDVIITLREPGSFATITVAPAPGTLVTALTTSGEADGVPVNDVANLMRSGSVWVRPEDAVTPASGVFLRHTANAGVGTALGAFRGVDDGGNTRDISTIARWATSSQGGVVGGFAKLIINLPNP